MVVGGLVSERGTFGSVMAGVENPSLSTKFVPQPPWRYLSVFIVKLKDKSSEKR